MGNYTAGEVNNKLT